MAGVMSALFAPHSRKERKVFLEAAKSGNVSSTALCIGSHPEIVTTTTFLQRRSALHLAAQSGHVTVLRSIVECLAFSASVGAGGRAAAPRDVKTLLNLQDSKGQTPLLLACRRGHVECARFLLAHGADLAQGDHRGNGPLHHATTKGHLGVMFLLLQGPEARAAGADSSLEEAQLAGVVNARNTAGFTPLHFAVWAGQSDALQVLLQHGADITAFNTDTDEDSIPCCTSSTALHLAATRGHLEISRILLKTYAERFLEPLSLPSGESPPESTLRHDPRVQRSRDGFMPFQVAMRLNYTVLAGLLLPSTSIQRLLTDEDRYQRFYGPTSLKAIAAEALNKRHCSELATMAAAASRHSRSCMALDSLDTSAHGGTIGGGAAGAAAAATGSRTSLSPLPMPTRTAFGGAGGGGGGSAVTSPMRRCSSAGAFGLLSDASMDARTAARGAAFVAAGHLKRLVALEGCPSSSVGDVLLATHEQEAMLKLLDEMSAPGGSGTHHVDVTQWLHSHGSSAALLAGPPPTDAAPLEEAPDLGAGTSYATPRLPPSRLALASAGGSAAAALTGAAAAAAAALGQHSWGAVSNALPSLMRKGTLGAAEVECSICLEYRPSVDMLPCLHSLCGPCALTMCSITQQKPSLCPLCRTLIAGFAPSSNKAR